MKCPKCGYNSFESHDSCKKCSSDLSGYKQTYGIAPIVFPLEIREKMADTLRAASAESEPIADSVETHEDMFAFDLPEETATAAATFKDDPFDFDEPASAAGSVQSTVGDDPFADLLETTPQVSNDPFAAPAAAVPQTAAATAAPGEFELENFSWDDTPAGTSDSGGQADADDFDSLFGDADESTKK